MCLDFISTVCCATLAGHDGHPHLGHDTDHIVPDFDDPDIPARVWDAYLRDGKITQEERERVAQHAAETGRAGKRTRDDIDTTGETQKKAKIDPDETGRKLRSEIMVCRSLLSRPSPVAAILTLRYSIR